MDGEGECQALAESVLGGEAGGNRTGEQLGRPTVPFRTGLAAVAPVVSTESPVPVSVHTVQGELRELGGQLSSLADDTAATRTEGCMHLESGRSESAGSLCSMHIG